MYVCIILSLGEDESATGRPGMFVVELQKFLSSRLCAIGENTGEQVYIIIDYLYLFVRREIMYYVIKYKFSFESHLSLKKNLGSNNLYSYSLHIYIR